MEVGRLINTLNPQVFKALLTKIDDTKQTAAQDLSKIPALFVTFCRTKDLDPNHLMYIHNRELAVMSKRLFIADMIAMYDPPLY
ncbi:hypothetical protein FC093_07715 [Ilyomonas limi]|uniref:Uncharacterized protein n=1 Tax=Ilyomonas limi TaxID=2575867 RepID=A0A4U3L2G2_9BACT|nr:hypothetical protein [Ilyomonas limi]TKK69198.1 hypothetical protein FC093_07715 [Ilyomonas limi]